MTQIAESAPRPLRLDDQLCFALYAATNAVTRAYAPLLAQYKLTYPQYLVMLVLWQDGPSLSGRIATRLGLGANAITPLVDKLVASGLVERHHDDTDRRTVTIQLTQAGLELEDAVSLVQQSVVCRTALEPEALARLRQELIELANRLGGPRQA